MIAAVAIGAGASIALRRDDRPPVGPATVVVDVAHPGRVVPRSFLGIATEWDSVGAYAGPAARRRTELVSLLRAVGRAQRSPVALRIGGDSADQSWWNPSGRRARPATVLNDLGPRVLDDAAWLARGLGGPVTLGLNLALGDSTNTIMMARQLRRRLRRGQLAAVELGNEPDFYARPERRWRVPGYEHVRVTKRPPGYGPADYGREAQVLLRAARRGLGRDVRLVGAGFATPKWWPALPGLLRTWRPGPDALAAHLYGFPECAGPSPGPDWLMAPKRAVETGARLDPLAQIAARARLPWRVTELNSAPCGGRAGMSDTPAAAVWLADTLFTLFRAGAQQADVQTWNHARYAVVGLTGAGAKPRPPLDGMLAFARAAPAGARLVPTTVSGGDEVRAWATLDRRRVRVLVIAPHGGLVRVRLPGGAIAIRLPRAGLAVLRSPRAA